jgi:oligopeptide/dipeptide ABC transporter ATP-binding protein
VSSAASAERLPAAPPAPGDALLVVRDLVKHFPIRGGFWNRQVGAVRAVEGVSFDLKAGETLGLVGETGCGKTTAARCILRLIEPTAGTVHFDGVDVLAAKAERLRALRRQMQIVFQDPYSSLNPRMTVGAIVGEPLLVNRRSGEEGTADRRVRRARVEELLALVGLSPEHHNRYPHEFSGGQRQRIGVARALALNPRLMILDEPVSALDVSIQAQVINLFESLQDRLGLTYLFIAHDLSVVRHISDRVAVMYLGRIVEVAESEQLYRRPLHPYTEALLSAIPLPDPVKERTRQRIILRGDVPNPAAPPTGCPFHPRCPKAQAICSEVMPPLESHLTGHEAACHFPND